VNFFDGADQVPQKYSTETRPRSEPGETSTPSASATSQSGTPPPFGFVRTGGTPPAARSVISPSSRGWNTAAMLVV
jgi:hypothetical protein